MAVEPQPRKLRRWLAALAGSAGIVACALASQASTVDVWVDLDEPVAVDAPDAGAARAHVVAQQERVLRELNRLGAVEIARIAHVRNAVAVRLPRASVAAVHGISGVVRVRPVDTLHPPRTAASSP